MIKTTQWLTFSIAFLAGTASAAGLLVPNLYRDSDLFKTAWLANDFVTLLLVPALLMAHSHHKAGNEKAYIVWLGLLLYMFYNYAFYLFGAAFNSFFVVYAALFSLSLYALLAGLSQFNATAGVRERYKLRHGKLIAIFLVLVALPLIVVELGQYLNFVMFGTEGEIPTLVLSLDLTIVIPNSLLAAVLLWRDNRWGVILGGMMLVKAFTYGLVLVLGAILIATRGIGAWDPLLPFYLFVSTGGFIFLQMLLKGIKPFMEELVHNIK
jgi:hypothetical protein